MRPASTFQLRSAGATVASYASAEDFLTDPDLTRLDCVFGGPASAANEWPAASADPQSIDPVRPQSYSLWVVAEIHR